MLEVSGSLHVAVDGERVEIRATGQRIDIEAERPRRVFGGLFAAGLWNAGTRVFARRLYAEGLTVVVTSRGRQILKVGSEARASLIGRLLRIPHLALFPRTPKR